MSSAASRVRPEQRFTSTNPCPICGGYERQPRGESKRCHGFISQDGAWARCTREEHAGEAPLDEKTGALIHKLAGDCKCGIRHDLASGHERNGQARRRSEQKSRIAKTYDYEDEHRQLLYQTVRYVPKDFRQRRPDGDGGWIWNLQGARLVPYRRPELIATAADELVLACAGEKDTDRAYERGFIATTTP
jgi:hypothetical protein